MFLSFRLRKAAEGSPRITAVGEHLKAFLSLLVPLMDTENTMCDTTMCLVGGAPGSDWKRAGVTIHEDRESSAPYGSLADLLFSWSYSD